MEIVTYLTDTNHDPHSHYILDENDQWYDAGEDREFLADNGFILTTIPVAWDENNLWLPYSTQIIDISYEILKALMKYRVIRGHADTFRTLSVLEHMGSAIVSIIEPLGCEIKGERRYQ